MQPSFPSDPFESFHYHGPQPDQSDQNPFNHSVQQPSTHSPNSFKIKLPPMTRSTRAHPIVDFDKSGSEYRESDGEDHMDTEEAQPIKPPSPKVQYTSSLRGRRYIQKTYAEPESEDVDAEGELDMEVPTPAPKAEPEDDDGGYGEVPRYHTRARAAGNLKGFIDSEEDEEDVGIRTRSRLRRHPTASGPQTQGRSGRTKPSSKPGRSKSARRAKKSARNRDDEDVYVNNSSSESGEHDISFDNVVTSPEPEPGPEEPEEEQEQERGGYGLRTRAKKNYDLVTMLDNITSTQAQPTKKSPRGKGRSGGNKFKGPGWSATGAQLGQWMGLGDDSDSDDPSRNPRNRGFAAAASGSGGLFAGGSGPNGLLAGDMGSGGPSNLGKVGNAILADADPLGVNQNVTFEEVGGLDDHINALKEMTLLPLLYPEVFQRFNLVPPRGVLFHGPPGTGKTLLARALAASCRSNGKGISFFMRKGADCLSKWVGEAERQLRLLFEEARNCQPSIIFFDEIDGLAPVRSSKQDQIHASIVSTLLALMDGMDGRGQVVVIGATNRPDAVDPALRRPGRFDREFYFPLPGLEAREKILRIITRKWQGWEGEEGESRVKGLAKLTKGYGGADLRALCTEAALNAVQRRYPQIYKSTDRLLLKPETIDVQLRDFMISVKKLVPSSARSASSAASSLPSQLVPLLSPVLEVVKEVVARVMPISKKRTALEEAEWEDDVGEEGAFDREMMLQTMEKLRIYRPRVVLYGSPGMGQTFVAAAILHHLEGYHVQTLDLGSLLGDSARTVEAGIVQLFVEAKRHQPSVIHIPSLVGWCTTVSETSRSTVRAMLDTLSPSDPILLLAVVDGPFKSLPRDVRAWFGPTKDNRVEIMKPSIEQRDEFFASVLADARRPPNQFPDGTKRRRRVLEELPIAPPVEPRQPTEAELAVQEENDRRVITLLKWRLGPILTELKRKFKRFTKRAADEYDLDGQNERPQPPGEQPTNPQVQTITTQIDTVEVQAGPDGTVEIIEQHQQQMQQVVPTNPPQVNGHVVEGQEPVVVGQPQPPPRKPHLYDMDLERVHVELYRNKYLTPLNFLHDIRKIVHNAEVCAIDDLERLHKAQAMLTATEVSLNEFDQTFRLECERMAVRERKRRDDRRKQREKEKAEREKETQTTETVDPNNPYAPGTRRSGRNSGQEPEVAITDPLQLERRLKRGRSVEGNVTDGRQSSEEAGEGRSSKRSRVASEDGQHTPQPLLPILPTKSTTPIHDGTLQPPQHDTQLMHPSPRRTGGFDPSLLNPAPMFDGVGFHLNRTPSTSAQNGATPPPPSTLSSTPTFPTQRRFESPNPFVVAAQQPQQEVPVVPAPGSVDRQPDGVGSEEQQNIPHPEGEQSTEPPIPEPMEVVRTPTPSPDFHIDEYGMEQLKDYLRVSTAGLNIEELEQLRSTCLAAVWRHRTEWDRTILISELLSIAKEFVQEVLAEDDEMSP
ncbi:AAA-domain-containing protein [Thelephora ganbajun]|uniref:AAA-domain-containing protein n=1 Tax=Thelephora ganbajun TaxID=370292 RepID=A0ACB6ZGQ6_THEGA|nr:AAA-domain-containing protein [Thelephora ganbajun]